MHALLYARLLCFKNRIRQLFSKKKDLVIYLIIPFFPVLVFVSAKNFFAELILHPRFDLVILNNIVYWLILAFGLVVTTASIIASIGNLYSAKDIPLLLTLPITKGEILRARYVSIILESSWTILLFLLPVIFSLGAILNLPAAFYLQSFLAVLLLSCIASSLGLILSCLAVNILGPKNCVELIIALMSAVLIYTMTFSAGPEISTSRDSIDELISYFSNDFSHKFSPHSFCAQIIASFWDQHLIENNLLHLFLFSLFSFFSSSLCYSYFFSYTPIEKKGKKKLSRRIYRPFRKFRHSRYFNGPLFAFISKEAKTLFRDLNQSVQFLILVFITFVYLLNFQQLRNKPNLEPEVIQWWYALLAISNITLSSCVLTAIATRFVFPSISMEGRSFSLLRSAPITLSSLVFYKFITWLIPFCFVALVILTAGALAIDANFTTLFYTLFIGINMSVGLVATAIGTGARYAKFDWDSPSQVAAGFGSLVLMIKLFAIVSLYITLASILIAISCINSLQGNQSIIVCILIGILMSYSTLIILRNNLKQGALALQQ